MGTGHGQPLLDGSLKAEGLFAAALLHNCVVVKIVNRAWQRTSAHFTGELHVRQAFLLQALTLGLMLLKNTFDALGDGFDHWHGFGLS
jgi:hypothetical protein